jgi:four helix bundle protein
MERENLVKDKSFLFAVSAIKLARFLQREQNEYVISKQFLRSATSVGANVEEAMGGESERDFVHKLRIAYKESREAHYWLRLMIASETVPMERIGDLILEAESLIRILGKIISTTKSKSGSDK